MMAAEKALPIPGSASSCSALAELRSIRSGLAAGAILVSAFGAGVILSDLVVGCGVCAVNGEAVKMPAASAAAATSEASVKRRMVCPSQGLIEQPYKASFEFMAAPWLPDERRIKASTSLDKSLVLLAGASE